MMDPTPSSRGRTVLAVLLLGVAGVLASASSSPPPPQAAKQPAMTPTQSPAQPTVVRIEQQYRYRGVHPVHPDFGRGFCQQQGEHTEPYPPFEPELFAMVNGAWVFIGDAGDFGYDGELYWYANPHPLPESYGEDWCYYPWPHRHHFMLSGSTYDVIGGIIYFVGSFTDGFFRRIGHKRAFYRRHYRSHYLRGTLYKRHRPRYQRVGRGATRCCVPVNRGASSDPSGPARPG